MLKKLLAARGTATVPSPFLQRSPPRCSALPTLVYKKRNAHSTFHTIAHTIESPVPSLRTIREQGPHLDSSERDQKEFAAGAWTSPLRE